jgi:hypothetical protein
MKTLLICLLLVGSQNGSNFETVRLQSDKTVIPLAYGGKLVELLNTPAVISLPSDTAVQASSIETWTVQIKNLGPKKVTIRGGGNLNVSLLPNESATIVRKGPGVYQRIR